MYAIIDCNNFYASCERLFRPELRHQPIVVLSNNDGCVIARSNEAKAFGIAMGIPYFKIQSLCQSQHVQVFSSNYALYGNLSDRVMRTIEAYWPHTEIYSIDEAFLDLKTLPYADIDHFAATLHQQVLKHIGIPTSIGLGKTKTLAKLANHVCKKILHIPVVNIMERLDWLQLIPVEEVWGVGRALTPALMKQGINTALDLSRANLQHFSLPLRRTILELNGVEAISLAESYVPPKSIVASRSFSTSQTTLDALNEALSNHCKTAYEKLRRHHLHTQHLQVFLRTNPFQQEGVQYANASHCTLPIPTDDLSLLTRIAKLRLNTIFRPGLAYKKIGICLTDFHHPQQQQFELFHPPAAQTEKTQRWLQVLDDINQKYGRHTLKLAASGCAPADLLKKHCSPAYTTKWTDLPLVF